MVTLLLLEYPNAIRLSVCPSHACSNLSNENRKLKNTLIVHWLEGQKVKWYVLEAKFGVCKKVVSGYQVMQSNSYFWFQYTHVSDEIPHTQCVLLQCVVLQVRRKSQSSEKKQEYATTGRRLGTK